MTDEATQPHRRTRPAAAAERDAGQRRRGGPSSSRRVQFADPNDEGSLAPDDARRSRSDKNSRRRRCHDKRTRLRRATPRNPPSPWRRNAKPHKQPTKTTPEHTDRAMTTVDATQLPNPPRCATPNHRRNAARTTTTTADNDPTGTNATRTTSTTSYDPTGITARCRGAARWRRFSLCVGEGRLERSLLSARAN